MSVRRPFPQQTIAVVGGRSKSAATAVDVVTMSGTTSVNCSSSGDAKDEDDDDIEDDFTWDNLIDKVDERPLQTVAMRC